MSLTTGSAAAAGGVLGGGVGALVGAGVGAGVSTVWWLKQDRQTQLPADSLIVMALTEPLPIQPLVHEPEYSGIAPTRAMPPSPVTEEAKDSQRPAVAAQSFVPTN